MKRPSFDGPTVGISALILGVFGFILADVVGTENETTIGHVLSKEHKEAWPELCLVDEKGKPHDGMADALCLAEFGRRLRLQGAVSAPIPEGFGRAKRKVRIES